MMPYLKNIVFCHSFFLPPVCLNETLTSPFGQQISNARVAGMNKELELHIGSRYTIALLVFFIPYFIFEVCHRKMSNFASSRLRFPHVKMQR